jgi:hypothetical protein
MVITIKQKTNVLILAERMMETVAVRNVWKLFECRAVREKPVISEKYIVSILSSVSKKFLWILKVIIKFLVHPPIKGNATLVLDTEDYSLQVNDLLKNHIYVQEDEQGSDWGRGAQESLSSQDVPSEEVCQ